MATTQTPEHGSPEWWLERLNRKLVERFERLRRYQAYYEGEHRLAFASKRFREAFGGLFSEYAENFCELVVDALEERLTVEGFRMGLDSGDGDPLEQEKADQDAWRIWQTNQLDAWSQSAHTTALVKEEAYALVSPFPAEWPAENVPLITIEDPLEMIVERSASDRRKRLAGFKRWIDDDGRLVATLYLPGGIYKYVSKRKPRDDGRRAERIPWEPRQVEGEEWPLPNPLEVVPIVPIVNRPRLNGTGRSELKSVVPVQDAVNKLVSDMLLAAEFGAFRQKYATNVPFEIDEETGKPKEPFKIAVDRLLVVEPNEAGEPEPRLGEFEQTDLAPYVKAIEQRIQHIASITRTPPHYLLGQAGSFPSGESLKATETGLVAKARRRMRYFGEDWEEVERLAFLALDDPRAKAVDSETIWQDPESRTEGEHVDALLKLKTLDVPTEILWEKAGFTPQQVARMRSMREAEALSIAAAFDPFRATAPTPAQPAPAQPAPAAAPAPGQPPQA